MKFPGALLLALLGGCSAEPAAVLRVCLGENDLPRSQAAPPRGFDVDVARLLARDLNRQLKPVWLEEPNPTEIESSDIDYAWLLNGRCDVQMSIPGVPALGIYAERLLLSEPYYGAGFELVPESVTLDLQAPGRQRVAVRGNSVAHLYIDRLGFDWTMRRDSDDIAVAIEVGDAAAGLIWGPELAALQLSYNRDVEPPVALRWNHHAVVRADDPALRDAINALFASAGFRNDIETLMRSHGMPPHQPFPSVHHAEALNGGW